MARVILRTEKVKPFVPQKKERRGAQVFGLPTSRELESFITDAYPSADQHRLMQMFFAGKVTSLSDDFEEDIDL